jgi:hypothetical protein
MGNKGFFAAAVCLIAAVGLNAQDVPHRIVSSVEVRIPLSQDVEAPSFSVPINVPPVRQPVQAVSFPIHQGYQGASPVYAQPNPAYSMSYSPPAPASVPPYPYPAHPNSPPSYRPVQAPLHLLETASAPAKEEEEDTKDDEVEQAQYSTRGRVGYGFGFAGSRYAGPNTWVRAESLTWWTKDSETPPLATAGTASSLGILDRWDMASPLRVVAARTTDTAVGRAAFC